ncbi:MAG: filamentous hemagglutinin N-terminal domain-containing protein, partial [candidate division NC10 bacterium]|nr:filamentous hemagglutinin N-terminal domain-containing protein [candidate division NC10 bacterium]
SIANILSRVTGGEPSAIDGLLRSTIPGANLFLLNPAGVLFGPNASLDVSGSFHVSTADYLRLADGGIFQATLAQGSVLTAAPPAAFGFLSGNPAGIAIQGSRLEVPHGKTLSVVGGGYHDWGARSGLRVARLLLQVWPPRVRSRSMSRNST